MALNINTNITNNLDGYLLDAKNVKGTYVVVQYYESLANLPSECVVEGSLAFVSWSSNNLHPIGFYQYVGNQWIYSTALNTTFEIIGIENATVSNEDDFDISSTYEVEIIGIEGSGSSATTNLQEKLKYYCKVSFTLGPVLYMSLDCFTPEIQCSCIYIYNNKKYIGLLNIDPEGTSSGDYTTFTGSLSFQEIEGGGTSATRTKYHIEVEDSNGNKAIIPIYQDTFEDYLVEFNQVGQTMATAMSITWTTINNIAEFKTLFDTQKSTQLAYGCDLGMNLLVKYAYESGENPVLKLFLNTTPDTYIDFAVSSLVDYNLANNLLGAVRSIELQNVATGTPDENYNYWFKPRASSNYPVIITIDQDATFTYTEEQVAGGNSSGGEVATKKWYEWKFADGMLTSNEIIFKLNENNFTFIVGRINAMMKQQDPTWQDISTSQEVVALYDQLKLLNDSTTIFALAYFLYNGALDSDTIPYFYRDQWQKREILNSDMYVAGTTSTQNATPYCFLIVDVNDNHTYEYVNLNASSTLVITETEETIGGGGGNTSSEEWYKWELKGTYASMSSTYNTFISYINETQMQEIYTAINTALSTSISTPQELINIYDISKADDLSQSMNFYLLSQMFSVVANYSYKNGKQVYLEDGDDGGIITPCQINILQGFANIYSIVVNSSSPTEWFVNNVTDATNGIHIAFDSASTLTITKL